MRTGDRVGALDCSAGTIVSCSVCALGALLVFAAVVLWWRRLVGALVNPLEPVVLLGAAVTVSAAAAAIRLGVLDKLAPAGQPSGRTRFARYLPWTVSASVVAIGVALSLRDTSLWGLVLFWTILTGEELWGWTPRRPLGPPPLGAPPLGAHVAAPPAVSPRREPATPISLPRPSDSPFPAVDECDMDAVDSPDVLQQLTRRRTADGGEILSGWLRVPLAANQRTANVHVAFCPPFPRNPQVAVDQLGGPAARIKKVQVLPYGTRLDLKLAEHSDMPGSVVLQFSALSGPPAQPVAETEHSEDERRELEHLG